MTEKKGTFFFLENWYYPILRDEIFFSLIFFLNSKNSGKYGAFDIFCWTVGLWKTFEKHFLRLDCTQDLSLCRTGQTNKLYIIFNKILFVSFRTFCNFRKFCIKTISGHVSLNIFFYRLPLLRVGNPAPPAICGYNTGQHMYVDSSDLCNKITFTLDTEVGFARKWDIKVPHYKINMFIFSIVKTKSNLIFQCINFCAVFVVIFYN